jgi:hypothetical protein
MSIPLATIFCDTYPRFLILQYAAQLDGLPWFKISFKGGKTGY